MCEAKTCGTNKCCEVEIIVHRSHVGKLIEANMVGTDPCPVCLKEANIDFFDNQDQIQLWIATGLCYDCQISEKNYAKIV
jgi:hypothetical protein